VVSKVVLGIRADAVRETIAALCEQSLDPSELIREVAERVRQVVPYDTGAWMPTDPETLLPTDLLTVGAGDVQDIQAAKARCEFMEHDLNRFVELDRSGRSVATLAAATDGELELSVRHRVVYAPNGLDDELRLLARSGNSTWALGCLVRATDRPAFATEEAGYVASIARHLGRGLRTGLARARRVAQPTDRPGMLVLDEDGRIEAATGEAERLMQQLPRPFPGDPPLPVSMVALQAAANATTGGTRPARARIRVRTGAWLLVHADVLDSARGETKSPRIAVMLEPAGPAEMLPLLLALHDLTDRERKVTELLVGGRGTEDIAARLHISRHTLRDHLKSIFAKVGVSSRGELTALLGTGAGIG
jgi:DNA-binding CsgD family transcriptional regulator